MTDKATTPPLTGAELDNLEALALAAAEYGDTIGIDEWHTVDGELNLLIPRPDVELISACSPVAILGLIAQARAQQETAVAPMCHAPAEDWYSAEDGVEHSHPEYGQGVFFTRDCARPAAAPDAAHAVDSLKSKSVDAQKDADLANNGAAHAQQDAAPKPCGWLAGDGNDGAEPMYWRREDAQRECDEHNAYERSRPDFDADNLRTPEPVYRIPAAVAPSDATGKADGRNVYAELLEKLLREKGLPRLTEEPLETWASRSLLDYIERSSATGKADAANAGGLATSVLPEAAMFDLLQRYASAVGTHSAVETMRMAACRSDRGEFASEAQKRIEACALREQVRDAIKSLYAVTSAADAKDAERYRWLRDHDIMQHVGSFAPYIVQGQTMRMLEGKEVDAAVDAAIAATQAAPASSEFANGEHTVQATPEAPSEKQEKLRALADRIDHEKLWKLPFMRHGRLTDQQRDRMNAGCMLRRYADLLAPGRWLVLPPTGNVQFSAGSLDKVYEMAKRDEDRRTAQQAQSSAKGGDV